MKIELTKSELYIIEREFDRLRSEHQKAIHQYMKTISETPDPVRQKLWENFDRRLDEWFSAYDLMSNISVKCEQARLAPDHEEGEIKNDKL